MNAVRRHRERFMLSSARGLRRNVDLSSWMPQIEDQGNTGSCSANALASVLEYLIKCKYHVDIELSRLFIYYNARTFHHRNETMRDHGATLINSAHALRLYGDCEEHLWPYKKALINQRPPPEVYEAARRYSVTPIRVPINLHSLKASLANGFPVVIGIYLRYSAGKEARKNQGYIKIPDRSSTALLSAELHAVVLCGYDDDTQHFLVRNSWGEKWGLKGYFFLPYKWLSLPWLVDYSDGAWTIQDVVYRNPHMPDMYHSGMSRHHKNQRHINFKKRWYR